MPAAPETKAAADAAERGSVPSRRSTQSKRRTTKRTKRTRRPQVPGDPHGEQRQRLSVRVDTFRDAFKMMGFMEISDDDRSAILAEINVYEEAARQPDEETEQAPEADPDSNIDVAGRQKLDRLESLVARMEDRFISVDESVKRETFRPQVQSGAHSKRAVARYGRLLASRRFVAGPRRDRFEFIATHLLAERAQDGSLSIFPMEAARTVLQQMIGGLPPSRTKDRVEGVAYLKEATERLAKIDTFEKFVESGFFLDVLGYKVSMRDQLVAPDFLFMSVALNVEVHNKVEKWIKTLERLGASVKRPEEESPRAMVEKLLKDQETAVQSVFGAPKPYKIRAAPVVAATGSLGPSAGAKKPKAKKKSSRISFADLLGDRQGMAALGLAVVCVLSLGISLYFSGVVGSSVEALQGEELAKLSHVLVRGWVVEGGVHLEGTVSNDEWEKLDTHQRKEVADELAKNLAERGITSARLVGMRRDGKVIIEIRDKLVTHYERD